MGKYNGCATCCQIMSMIAIPLLAYFGLLAYVESPLLEIPAENKPDAAIGCWIASAMYAGTYVLSTIYKSGSKKGGYQPAPRAMN